MIFLDIFGIFNFRSLCHVLVDAVYVDAWKYHFNCVDGSWVVSSAVDDDFLARNSCSFDE